MVLVIILYVYKINRIGVKIENKTPPSSLAYNTMVNLLYISTALEKRDNIGSRFGYYATKDIKRATLLIVEHVFTGNFQDAIRYIHFDQDTWEPLHPRGPTIKASEKVISNVFGEGDEYNIGLASSFFNHSCTPNTASFFEKTSQHPFHRTLVMFYTLKDISKNTQLCIQYNTVAGHGGHGFTCDCGASDETRHKRLKDVQHLVSNIHDQNTHIAFILLSYVNSQDEVNTTFHHHLIRRGIIHVKGVNNVSTRFHPIDFTPADMYKFIEDERAEFDNRHK
jgi:hypothetical protein